MQTNFGIPIKTAATLDIAAASHLGHSRRRNEDSCFSAPARGLAVVADGVGGQGDGAWASQKAVDLFCARMAGVEVARADWMFRETSVLEGLQLIHDEMLAENRSSHGKASGTTIAGIWAPGGAQGAVTAFNVGDSPIFHYSKRKIEKISRDHSLHQLWLDGGQIGKAPGKRMIVQAVGISDRIAPHVVTLPVQLGDALLICTDGLSGVMEPAQMGDILGRARSSQEACDLMLAAALAGDARDNVTVSVCYF